MNTPALSPKMEIRKKISAAKRDEITDIAKGIGILLVVALHCGIGFMAGVDMPLFFFISGFFAPTLAKCPFAEGLKRKSVDLLKPTFLYVIFFGVFAFILCRLPEVNTALLQLREINVIRILSRAAEIPKTRFFEWLTPVRVFYDTMTSWPSQPLASPLWFAPALWAGFVLWFVFRPVFEWYKQSSRNKIIVIAALIFLYYSAVNGGIPIDITNRLAGWLARAVYAFCFIGFGHIVYRHRDFLLYGKGQWILWVLALGALYWKKRYFHHFPGIDIITMFFETKIRPRSFLIAFCGIALVFLVSRYAAMIRPVKQALIHIGKESFHIMAIHFVFIWLFWWIFILAVPDISPYRDTVPIKWLVFLFAVTMSLISVGICRFLEKTAGKKRAIHVGKTLPSSMGLSEKS